jgi:hypothetical protein
MILNNSIINTRMSKYQTLKEAALDEEVKTTWVVVFKFPFVP